jgi:hypothetical protein
MARHTHRTGELTRACVEILRLRRPAAGANFPYVVMKRRAGGHGHAAFYRVRQDRRLTISDIVQHTWPAAGHRNLKRWSGILKNPLGHHGRGNGEFAEMVLSGHREKSDIGIS